MADLSLEELLAEKARREASKAPAEVAPASVDTAPEFSKIESFGQGALDIGSFGASDEAIGAYHALMAKLGGNQKEADFGEAYRKYRDLEREKQKAASEQNPWSYGAGGLAGAVGAGMATGGLGLAGKAGTAGANIVKAAAIEGGALGLGTSEAELTGPDASLANVGEAAKDIASGAVIGGATAGLLKGASNLIKGESKIQLPGKAYKKGLEGITTFGTEAKEKAAKEAIEYSTKLSDAVEAGRKKVGAAIEDVFTMPQLHKEEAKGMVNVKPALDKFMSDLGDSPTATDIKETIMKKVFKETDFTIPETVDVKKFLTIKNILKKIGYSKGESGSTDIARIARDAENNLSDTARNSLLNDEGVKLLDTLNPQYSAAKQMKADYLGTASAKGRSLKGKKPAEFINRMIESAGPESQSLGTKVESEQFVKLLEQADPKLASEFKAVVPELRLQRELLGSEHGSFRPGHVLGTLEEVAAKGANLAGRGVSAVKNTIPAPITKTVSGVSSTLQKASPDNLTRLAAEVSKDIPVLGEKLAIAAKAPDKATRAATLFSLHQIPAFRNLAKMVMPGDEEE